MADGTIELLGLKELLRAASLLRAQGESDRSNVAQLRQGVSALNAASALALSRLSLIEETFARLDAELDVRERAARSQTREVGIRAIEGGASGLTRGLALGLFVGNPVVRAGLAVGGAVAGTLLGADAAEQRQAGAQAAAEIANQEFAARERTDELLRENAEFEAAARRARKLAR